jgi:hypothetical protein
MLVYEPDCILWFVHILAVHGYLLPLTRDSPSKNNHGTVYLYQSLLSFSEAMRIKKKYCTVQSMILATTRFLRISQAFHNATVLNIY